MWAALGKIDPRFGVPRRALWLQAALACALVLSGEFEDLYTMVSLAMLLTGALTVLSLFVLRRKLPDAPRPYRATGYPYLPALYILASILTIGIKTAQAFSGEPGAWYPLLGIVVLALAWLGHRLSFGEG